ncbi:hypothetical protein QBC35DRAFT_455353 [Podospora australis]|uniref:Uncharacterized protein n=1 Tax=Podospora australis TaxID=1536484 RepID=A0AAN6WN47_9PEZI|nr:hypothetical protein QBC35DRAFT_455353 [Podospora australis]
MHRYFDNPAVILAFLFVCLAGLTKSSPIRPPILSSTASGMIEFTPTIGRRDIGQEPSYCARNWTYTCGYTCYWIDYWAEVNENLVYRECDVWFESREHQEALCKDYTYCVMRPGTNLMICDNIPGDQFCPNLRYDIKCDGYNKLRRHRGNTERIEARNDGQTAGVVADQSGENFSDCGTYIRKTGPRRLSAQVGEVTANGISGDQGGTSLEGNIQVYVTFENGTRYVASAADRKKLVLDPEELEAGISTHQHMKLHDCYRVYC